MSFAVAVWISVSPAVLPLTDGGKVVIAAGAGEDVMTDNLRRNTARYSACGT
ncbi:MAG: hypothetical protein ABSG17_07425 [Spirochaetia bacterium]